MTRDTEATLLDFCARQHERFDAAEWLAVPHPDRDEFICATLFLAGVDWYGHLPGLVSIAESLEPGSPGNLSLAVSRTGFDLSRFSTLLKRKLKHASIVSPS
jgi:hypothetical protein